MNTIRNLYEYGTSYYIHEYNTYEYLYVQGTYNITCMYLVGIPYRVFVRIIFMNIIRTNIRYGIPLLLNCNVIRMNIR